MGLELNDQLQRDFDDAARVLLQAKHGLAFIGAGMSAQSGIPTFRGPGGLWTKKGEPDMRGYEKFLQDPKAWWENRLNPPDPDMAAFNDAIEAAEPNPGHYALAEMEQEGLIKYILTQNVDNLHRKAGSTKVAEIHGNRTKLRCINCVSRFEHEEIPLDPLPPRCPHCQGLVKGDGVMFGEPIPSDVLALCEEQAGLCDAMVLIGTSAVVYPAAGFPLAARRRGAFLVEVNPLETALSDACDIALRAPSAEALQYLLERARAISEDTR